jgi:hypothetical protein
MANIKKLFGLTSPGDAANPTLYRYTRHMEPILNVSQDADALDCSQIFLGNAVWDDGTNFNVLYNGQSAHSVVYAPDGLTYENNDQMFLARMVKSNDVTTGWSKVLDVNGDPKPVFKPSFTVGRFDRHQLWMRTVIKEGSTLKGWYSGDPQPGTPQTYKIGLATSTDNGETWTRHSTSAIYEDALTGSSGIVVFLVTEDGAGGYVAVYSGIDPNLDGIILATSADGISWTKTSTLFVGLEYGWPWGWKKIGSDYYLWLQKEFRVPENYGPAKKIFLLRSSNLTDWTFLGDQFSIRGSNEFGLAGFGLLQKPNGNYFALINSYKNKIENVWVNSGEPFVCIKAIELNRSDLPVANAFNIFSYPSYVAWHAPLGLDTQLTEVIGVTTGVISSGSVAYSGLQYINLSGSQTLTFSGISINTSTFGFKMAISIVTSGTLELFRIGDDILVTIETGKLRVRLSSDGLGYEKDYITTVNISKPTGINYIDDHIYIGFTFIGGVLKLYNDFVEFTSGEITKTVDDALTNINNSQDDILIGQNAAIEVRSVSILSGATDQQWIDLDI